MSIGKKSATPNFTVDASGNVTTAGAITITAGALKGVSTSSLATTSGSLATSLAEVSNSYGIGTSSLSASIGTKINPYETQVQLTPAGMNLRNQADNKTLASYGVVTELFADGSTSNKAILDSSGLAVVQGGVTRSIFGSDVTLTGGTVTIGSSSDKVTITDGDIKLRTNNVDEFQVTNGLVTMGNTSGAQIFIDTVGGDSGIRVQDKDNVDIAFIGESAGIASRTTANSALPTTNAVRGIVTAGLTADQAIITGSLTADSGDIANITGDVLTITGSANVGGLVTSGSVRNTSTGAATSVLIHAHNGSNTLFQVKTDGEVLARDNITAFNTSGFSSISDKRLKTNIQPISQSLNKILKLEPKNFSWIENNERDSGFIAQDVEKVIPEVVQETKGFVDIDSNETEDTKYKTIAYSKLTIYLVDAIKELTKRVEELEKENKILRVD